MRVVALAGLIRSVRVTTEYVKIGRATAEPITGVGAAARSVARAGAATGLEILKYQQILPDGVNRGCCGALIIAGHDVNFFPIYEAP